MKSIQRNFNEVKRKCSHGSSYLCFIEVIKSKRFSKQTISRWFNKLVDPEDYEKNEKKDILRFLESITNMPEDNQKYGGKALLSHESAKKEAIYELLNLS